MIDDRHGLLLTRRDTYEDLSVPWKRGNIYHGAAPGNGKTDSVKVMMHTLYSRQDPVPSLYVRSFFSVSGPPHLSNRPPSSMEG